MMDSDYRSRMQMASERADRMADDYARANASSYRSRSRQMPRQRAWEPAEWARRRAVRPRMGA